MNTIKEEIKRIKTNFPEFKTFIEIEYQLDMQRALVVLAYPHKNEKNSDYSTDVVKEIKVNQIYGFIKDLEKTIDIVLVDTTEGDYYHKNTLEDTLKEFSHLFQSTYGCGRDWLVESEVKHGFSI